MKIHDFFHQMGGMKGMPFRAGGETRRESFLFIFVLPTSFHLLIVCMYAKETYFLIFFFRCSSRWPLLIERRHDIGMKGMFLQEGEETLRVLFIFYS